MKKNIKNLGLTILVVFALFFSMSGLVSAVAPTLDTNIPDQTWDEDFPWQIDLNDYFSDPEAGALTYTYIDEEDIIVTITNNIAEFTFDDEDWTGTNSVIFTATDDEVLSTSSNAVSLKKEVPSYCEYDEVNGKISIGDIDFDNDDYNIGDTVKVDIENVEAEVEDLENVEVEICLYNINEDEEIDCWTSEDTPDIDENDDEDFNIDFEIPNTEDIGSDDNYALIVVVRAEDEEGDDQCFQASEDITIEREKHHVIIQEFIVNPSIVSCGGSTSFKVEVENIGTKAEDEVYIKILAPTLGIDQTSQRFDLEEFDEDDYDMVKTFSFTVPTNADAIEHQLEAMVFYDDGRESTSKLGVLKVANCQPKLTGVALNVPKTSYNVNQGATLTIPFTVVNNEDSANSYIVEVLSSGWAETVSQVISLGAGQESTVYAYVNVNADATATSHTSVINVKDGSSIIASKSVNVNVESTTPTGATTGFQPNTTWDSFWRNNSDWILIVALALLVAVIVLLIVLIAKR